MESNKKTPGTALLLLAQKHAGKKHVLGAHGFIPTGPLGPQTTLTLGIKLGKP